MRNEKVSSIRGGVSLRDLRRLAGDESGQVLPWVVVAMIMVLGMSALVVDIGHAMVIQRQLQASADAAALAAAETLPGTNYSTVGQKYSAGSGGENTYSGVSIGAPTITPLCLTTVTGWGIGCTSSNPNAIQVKETATVPTLFAGIFGVKNITLSATSTASPGRPQPYNVAIILDTTPSMADEDSNCGKTQLACAVTGVQQLLKGLEPSMDNVSLFTFPNLDTGDVSNEYNCAGTNNLPVPPYTFPLTGATSLAAMPYYYTTVTGSGYNQKTTTTTGNATYQIVGYSNDYRSSDTATTLNTSSNLVKAVGGKSGCASMGTGYENTYYAGAIYAAQASLVAEHAANPNTMNAIIMLSDGNATAKMSSPTSTQFVAGSHDMVSNSTMASGTSNYATSGGSYGSWNGQCGQGVDAAQAASNAGTVFYTISYGSPTTSSSGNCASDRSSGDHQGISPCQAMQQMSTGWNSGTYTHFYSDYNVTGGDSGCQAQGANNGTTAISDIYMAIAAQLSGARLIPNSTP